MAEMSESHFNQMIDDLLMGLEVAIDDSGLDIDYDTSGGVMTLHFSNGTQIIINRQTPVRQLWLATRGGGFHFDYDGGQGNWVRDSDGAEFFSVLNAECSRQAGEPVELQV